MNFTIKTRIWQNAARNLQGVPTVNADPLAS